MDVEGFSVNANRFDFGEVTKLATVLSQHVAFNGGHVPETTLCVMFGAP